jgi:8-oxo-dGTP pyrophosphatase MutT (NUDIX family)
MTAPIRAAASLVLVWPERRAVLMGQRGASAAFMASKVVFPGGGVDPEDLGQAPQGLGPQDCAALERAPLEGSPTPGALEACLRRELTEETGLRLAPDAPLRFIFRAITPRGAPRRFDARFFLADVGGLVTPPEDFSQAGDELSHLAWRALDGLSALDLPFITEIVLAEVRAHLDGRAGAGIPFFDNSGPTPRFSRL